MLLAGSGLGLVWSVLQCVKKKILLFLSIITCYLVKIHAYNPLNVFNMKSERDRINELVPNKKIFLFFPPWVMEISIYSH